MSKKVLVIESDFDAVPVVILSGFAPDDGGRSISFKRMVRDTTVRLPDGFIDKPVDVNAFISLVRRLTQHSEE